jgi:hypothetical protein
MMRKLTSIVLLFLILVGYGRAQQTVPVEWSAKWRLLLGSWHAAGKGNPGEGAGEFSFQFDLQKRVIVRRSHTDYAASADRPAFTHDDLMIIYASGSQSRADYYDNEGHVIRYTIEFSNDDHTCTLTSDIVSGQPGFRLTYSLVKDSELAIKFEIAPPNDPKAFKMYVQGVAHKK